MKLFLVLLVLMGTYMYFLMHTTDIVLAQTQELSNTYQYVANNSDKIIEK